jgi:hypothetical protein
MGLRSSVSTKRSSFSAQFSAIGGLAGFTSW